MFILVDIWCYLLMVVAMCWFVQIKSWNSFIDVRIACASHMWKKGYLVGQWHTSGSDMFLTCDSCWYLIIFVYICWYFSIFLDICWKLCEDSCWYLLIFDDIYPSFFYICYMIDLVLGWPVAHFRLILLFDICW